jgi:hypothetical protein
MSRTLSGIAEKAINSVNEAGKLADWLIDPSIQGVRDPSLGSNADTPTKPITLPPVIDRIAEAGILGGLGGFGEGRSGLDFGGLTEAFPRDAAQGLIEYCFNNIGGVNTNIEPDKQGKHIVGHRNFQGNSELTHPDPQSLVDKFSGTGQPVNKIPLGQPGSVERVDFGEIIGNYVDPTTQAKTPSSIGTIRYSKNGVHIVTARPKI